MKVRVAVAVVALLLACAAVGWSRGRGEGSGPGSTASPSTLLPYNLLWYTRGRGPEPDEAMIEEAANRYLKPRINATIRMVNIDRPAYPEKMAGFIAGGEAYDMAFTASWLGYVQYSLKGAFAPLNDPKDRLLDTWMPKTKATLGRDFLASAAVNDILYAVPVEKEHAHSYGYELRRDLVEKYRMDVSRLKTFEDLEPLLRTVKDNEPSVPYPLSPVAGNTQLLDFIGLVAGTPVVAYPHGTDHRIYNEFDLPQTLKCFATARRYFLEGFVNKDAANSWDWMPDILAGKAFAVSSVTIPGDDQSMENATGMAWVEVNMTRPAISTGESTGAMNAISITSRDKARAAMFMELMNTDAYLNNLINFGVEGVHWVRVSADLIDFAPSTNNGRSSGYNPQIQWMLGNQRLNYLFPNEDPNKWKAFDAYNQSAVPDENLGFIPDITGLESEVAAITNVMAEYWRGLELGSSDPAIYVPMAREKLKASGIDRLIAEIQKQYDAWWARKPPS
jgi:putative aldouronate transport system substrate-binding protein